MKDAVIEWGELDVDAPSQIARGGRWDRYPGKDGDDDAFTPTPEVDRYFDGVKLTGVLGGNIPKSTLTSYKPAEGSFTYAKGTGEDIKNPRITQLEKKKKTGRLTGDERKELRELKKNQPTVKSFVGQRKQALGDAPVGDYKVVMYGKDEEGNAYKILHDEGAKKMSLEEVIGKAMAGSLDEKKGEGRVIWEPMPDYDVTIQRMNKQYRKDLEAAGGKKTIEWVN
jgi:uncharacterized protein YnzC (UPF0291/DUF896 family)